MAKTGFWLRGAKGKLAGTTIYKGKTGTIQREIVSPSNPQSEGQMTQRSRFLSAVRFYQRSNQRFFKMAFEGKRQGESDFNAFMRHNAKLGPYITKAQGDAIGFPVIAPWIVTQGSLTSPKQNTIYEGVEGTQTTRFGLSICPISEYSGEEFPQTVGALAAAFFEHNPNMREGDILTFVTIDANIAGEDFIEDLDAQGMQTSEPSWFIRQIVLDSSDNTSLGSLGLSVVMLGEQEDNPDLVVTTSFNHAVKPLHAGAGVVVVSRNTSSGLKVSNSVLALNDTAYNVYTSMRSNSYLQKVLAWWGAQQQAILQGSVAENKQQKVSAKVTLIGGQRPVAELSYSAGQAKSVGITFDSDPVGVTADNFIVEGEGVTKTYNNSILTLTFANPGEYTIKFGSQKIAVAVVEGEPTPAPEFESFKGFGATTSEADVQPLSNVGDKLESAGLPGNLRYVLVNGSNLENMDVNMLSTSPSGDIATLNPDGEKMYIRVYCGASVHSGSVRYNGVLLFTYDVE